MLLKYAKVKSWSTFKKSALAWWITEKEGAYRLVQLRKSADRGWEGDETRAVSKVELARVEATVDEIARQVAVELQRPVD